MQAQMDIVLDLQKLELPEEEVFFGTSCTSSKSDCCKGQSQN
jgi:hypothetical protein